MIAVTRRGNEDLMFHHLSTALSLLRFQQTLPSRWRDRAVRTQILERLAASATENRDLPFFHSESGGSALILLDADWVICLFPETLTLIQRGVRG